MAAYDIFLNNYHSNSIANIMIRNNGRLLKFLLCKYFKDNNKKINVLEVGPGKGYFKDAILLNNKSCNRKLVYFAADRNENILANLKIEKRYTRVAALPDITFETKFDIIMVGYVLEHLASGMELYKALENLKSLLSENGILVLLFPDSMKLGMEFYNIDYTHIFPTTKRNVNQAILDNNMVVDLSVDLSGILYTKKVDSRIGYKIKRILFFFYNYNIASALGKIIYRVPVWDINSIFWRAYGLLKEPNVLFVVKCNKHNKTK